MFAAEVYKNRRDVLQKRLGKGVVLLLGNVETPMNYPANTFPFRQDSTFLYYFGIDRPGFAGLIDLDDNESFLVGDDFGIDDIIWMGIQPKVASFANQCGADSFVDHAVLRNKIEAAVSKGRRIHFLPPYRPENTLLLSDLLGIQAKKLGLFASTDLISAIVAQREIKTNDEIAQIELALDISWEMVGTMMKMARSGVGEYEIVGAVDAVLASRKSGYSFPIILSVHGETLHNHHHGNVLKPGNLLVCDSGAESPEHYASDITRTLPVDGRFSSQQRDVYQIVLNSQKEALKVVKPGVPFREAHMAAAKAIFLGLKDIGLTKGNVEDALKEGAHALFFPHGLGHMMGLDVHDMEDYGENHIGYNTEYIRSTQFGLAYLRMAKPVLTGHVLTVEPGLYFIPELIDLWSSDKKWADFIHFDKLEAFKRFGGVRIEDDIVITEDGYRVLGRPIPKEVEDLESLMSQA